GARAFLVGGYTGSRFASAVLRVGPHAITTTIARLPQGLRYAGVAAIGPIIYAVGGLTTGGETSSIVAIDTRRGSVRTIGQLASPVAHAPLVARDSVLYLIGGTAGSGATTTAILRIDPRTGSATVAGHLPAPLADASAVTLGGQIVVLGGGGRAVYAF
ncbi:MAG: hypothetical protein QOE10_142, partial [Gaiellales bacterium]|nr:hypothetical protein [Gaiellales bacterium]